MDRITKKLIKYFIIIITIVVLICFIFSSFFLSSFYIGAQYSKLKNISQEIYSALKSSSGTSVIVPLEKSTSALLIKDNMVRNLGMGRQNIAPILRNIQDSNLLEQGKYTDIQGNQFLYYKLSTDVGDIVVIQESNYSSNYLNIVYVILSAVFLIAILFSTVLISFLGKKFTKPILKLQKASYDIAQGNFNIDTKVNTHDEIEDLSISLNLMAMNLEKKYALQRDFIANVSHDFKTPLSIIRNYGEAINDGILDEENILEYSKEIIREVDRLNSLVMNILQLSKLQGGGYTLKMECFDLNEFLYDCSSKFSLLASQKNIELKVNTPSLQVYGDSNYLYRVVYNFIDNALKFSFQNTKIEIYAMKIEGNVKVAVKNVGIGIEKEIIQEVWSRYYKQNKSGGMGLGLAICSEILKLHGFEYGVNSIPNKETEFYFIIPNSFIKEAS